MSSAPLPMRPPTGSPPPPPAPRPDWAYFFDIDGTLVHIAETPEGVQLDLELARLLKGLYMATGGAVALMSGRALADIDRLFSDVRFPAAGQHGAERRDARGGMSLQPVAPASLEAARQILTDAIEGKPGLLLEFKGLSLALHYRQVPKLAGFVHHTMHAVLAQLGSDYCVQTGKSVVELKPCGKDKGRAVLDFMQEPPFAGRVAVFVGDDDTDELGFETVNRLGGHSIKVGLGDTAARWRLPDVNAVQAWLRSI
jgi:trehalose 6-phosphate phosphatase